MRVSLKLSLVTLDHQHSSNFETGNLPVNVKYLKYYENGNKRIKILNNNLPKCLHVSIFLMPTEIDNFRELM